MVTKRDDNRRRPTDRVNIEQSASGRWTGRVLQLKFGCVFFSALTPFPPHPSCLMPHFFLYFPICCNKYIQYQYIHPTDIFPPNCWQFISNTNIHITKCTILGWHFLEHFFNNFSQLVLLFLALFWALKIGTFLERHFLMHFFYNFFLGSPFLWHFFGHLNEHFFRKALLLALFLAHFIALFWVLHFLQHFFEHFKKNFSQ